MRIMLFLVVLAAALTCRSAETNVLLANHWWTMGKTGCPPAGLEISLVADKTNFFLGENILLHYRIHNASTQSFRISVGGDYRGSTRSMRFDVTAGSPAGQPVTDPAAQMLNFGGLVNDGEIKPGADWFEKVWVIKYCQFDAPGTYKVRVFHDLGFGEQIANDPRPASISIRLNAPSEAEAEAMLVEAEMAKPYDGGTWGKRGEARLDYHNLRWPTFLKPLAKRAQTDNDSALAGISSIRTVEATRVLVGLLAHSNTAFAATAAQALEVRLPHPQGDFTQLWELQPRPLRIAGAWDETLAPAVRAGCVCLLGGTNRGQMLAATALLRLIGTTNELPALKQALEFVLQQTNAEYLADIQYPAPVRIGDSLIDTIWGIDLELAAKLDPQLSPGNLVLYLCGHGGADQEFSEAGAKVFADAMRSDLPFVRMKALEKLPDHIPAALTEPVTHCLTDSNIGVQNYAFLAAWHMEVPQHCQIALAVLSTAHDQWLCSGAEELIFKYGARYDCAMAWCTHLQTPKDSNDYTPHEALRHLLHLLTGCNSGGGFDPPLTDESARALRERWEKFLSENKTAIQAGKLFNDGDTGVPPALLPQGWTLNPKTRQDKIE